MHIQFVFIGYRGLLISESWVPFVLLKHEFCQLFLSVFKPLTLSTNHLSQWQTSVFPYRSHIID